MIVLTKSTLCPLIFKSVIGFMNRGNELSADCRFHIIGELNTACCIGKITTNEIRLKLPNPETLDLI